MPITVITTSSSTSVNPRLGFGAAGFTAVLAGGADRGPGGGGLRPRLRFQLLIAGGAHSPCGNPANEHGEDRGQRQPGSAAPAGRRRLLEPDDLVRLDRQPLEAAIDRVGAPQRKGLKPEIGDRHGAELDGFHLDERAVNPGVEESELVPHPADAEPAGLPRGGKVTECRAPFGRVRVKTPSLTRRTMVAKDRHHHVRGVHEDLDVVGRVLDRCPLGRFDGPGEPVDLEVGDDLEVSLEMHQAVESKWTAGRLTLRQGGV